MRTRIHNCKKSIEQANKDLARSLAVLNGQQPYHLSPEVFVRHYRKNCNVPKIKGSHEALKFSSLPATNLVISQNANYQRAISLISVLNMHNIDHQTKSRPGRSYEHQTPQKIFAEFEAQLINQPSKPLSRADYLIYVIPHNNSDPFIFEASMKDNRSTSGERLSAKIYKNYYGNTHVNNGYTMNSEDYFLGAVVTQLHYVDGSKQVLVSDTDDFDDWLYQKALQNKRCVGRLCYTQIWKKP